MSAVKVSVIVPVYNVEKYLRQCLDSIVNQTLKEIEIICVDDGSTDSSPAILAEYAANDSRVKVITRPKTNAGAARNAGMAIATGEWLLFLDADDVFSFVMIESLYLAALRTKAEIVNCQSVRFDDNVSSPILTSVVCDDFEIIDHPVNSVNPYHEWKGWAWDKLVSRSLIERHHLVFQEQNALNDFAFTMSACCLATRIARTQTVFVDHRNHSDSIESTRDRAPRCFAYALKRHHKILSEYGLWTKYPELLRNFANYVLRLAFWSLDTTKSSSAVAEVYEELQHLLPDMNIPTDDPVFLGEYPHWYKRYRKIMDGLDLVSFFRSENYDLYVEKENLRQANTALQRSRDEVGEKLSDVLASSKNREAILLHDNKRAHDAFEKLRDSYVCRLGVEIAVRFSFFLKHFHGYSLSLPAFPALTALPASGYPQRFVSRSKLRALPLTDKELKWSRPTSESKADRTIRCVAHDDCTGCGACVNRCPQNAIKMSYDAEGFLHPGVDAVACVNCGLCLKSCPVAYPPIFNQTPKAYAVWAADSIRLKSSSGGMFSILANDVLRRGGAVCGSVYASDYMTVYHAWAESERELAPLRGSKYVQSDTGMAYRHAKDLLEAGRPVLYTGCPCQIAGLYKFLGGKIYPNLTTADVICHGANSTTAYQSFIREFAGKGAIRKVDFRDKKYFTWSTPTVVYFADGSVKKAAWNESRWYDGFLKGVINRPNCYRCPYARAERVADLTLGDCWKVHEINAAYDDRKGTSLVLPNSQHGVEVFKSLRQAMKLCEMIDLETIRKFNGQLNNPTIPARSRRFFFSHLASHGYHKALWYGLGMRWDVGVVGWWFASNYGSSLTYYALGSILEDMGRSVIFIPVAKPDGNPFEPEIRQTVDFIAKYFKIANERDFRHMPEYNRFCDSFMVGSDQMWTASTTNLVGYSFFLDFVHKDKKKIAFSTSFGQSAFKGTRQQIATAKDFLSRFDAISTREQSGVDICREQFGLNAQQVFDPVFLCSRARYDLLTENQSPRDRKYLLCYILDPTPAKESAALAIAQREGLEIVTILGIKEFKTAKDKWHTGETLTGITTEGFLTYIRHCDYLITDSHHGTCFGIIYHKPYIALVNLSRGRTRFETVAEKLGLMDRLVDDPAVLIRNENWRCPIDYVAVEARLMALKQYAHDWLTTALAMPVRSGGETENTRREESRRIWN